MDQSFQNETWNDWAYDRQGNEIHISTLERSETGKNGYFCTGCEAEMQAVIPRVKGIRSYFRHDSGVINRQVSCTYGSAEIRHRHAKDILQRIKKIKVPTLYKFPPKGVEGKAYKLLDSGFVTAHRVENDLTFYQTEDGDIKWGRNLEINEEDILLKPDVSFFDSDGIPLLLIEFVTTRAIKNEKKVRLRQLGMNTIQVRIPPVNPEGIEACFLQTKHTKWIYHEREANTEYFRVSGTDEEGISDFDAEQGKLLEEGFQCREAQIRRFIRSIERCLGARAYQDFETSLEREKDDLEQQISTAESDQEQLRKSIQAGIHSEFAEEEEGIAEGRRRLSDKEREFRRRATNLGQRYKNKRGAIIQQLGDLEREEGNLETEEREFDARTNEESHLYRQVIKDFTEDLHRIRRTINQERRDLKQLEERTRKIGGEYEAKRKRLEEQYAASTAAEEKRIGESIQSIRAEIDHFDEYAANEHRRIEQELQAEFDRKVERIQRGTAEGDDELSRGINDALQGARLLQAIIDTEEEIDRIREAKEFFERKAWKSWPE